MSHLGLGVMIGLMSDNSESVAALTGALNKRIDALAMENDALIFAFADGSKIKIYDDGQSCCENRYMRTDDELQYFVGSVFIGAELVDAPDQEDEYGVHEVQFLKVSTSKGVFTMQTHNEHNGYYGGFLVRCAVV